MATNWVDEVLSGATSTGSKTQTQMYTEFNNAPLTSGWNEVINHFSAYQLNSLKIQ